jgi:hypothetical protein
MYPESNATKQDYITKSKIALIDYRVSNLDSAHSWHVWKPTNVETLLSQQVNMIKRLEEYCTSKACRANIIMIF